MPLPSIHTGIVGLDDVLAGGFPANRLYLVQGDPGTGKTTMALQFLMEGAAAGEPVLFLSLSETEDELRTVARSHGWDLEGITIFELSAAQQNRPAEHNTLFHPSEVELNEVTQELLQQVERIKPTRVVVDSLSELRLLAQSPLRFRRQILALKQYFAGRKCTVLLLDDLTGEGENGDQAHSVAHGVLEMQQLAPEYGADRRRLRIMKLRGVKFRSGWHDYVIETGGLKVFPRLVSAEHKLALKGAIVASGIPELDALLGGGIDRGTSLLIIGPAGCGKTTIAMQFAIAAIGRGERAAVYLFDENTQTLMTRCQGVGMNLQSCLGNGALVQQINPAEMSPGEFSHTVRAAVERERVGIVVIDSLNGYMNSMPEERFLLIHMHELLSYLGQQGVLTILTMAQHGLMGKMETPIDISYLSDGVMVLRYFEAMGEIKQSIAVLKKRTGQHERTLRDFRITSEGIRVGEPLRNYQGVLTGVPSLAPVDSSALKPPTKGRGMSDTLATSAGSRDGLVLVLAPSGRDALLTCALLRERGNIAAQACSDMADLCNNIEAGAGAVIVTADALELTDTRRLVDVLAGQLPWSDLPLLVMTIAPEETSHGMLSTLRLRGIVTVLERPVRIMTLLTAVQSALRARQRQYEVRDLLAASREAIRHRDQFLAMLGHELRNPLGAITNAMTVLEMTTPAAGEIENEHRDIIRRQTDHLARLVDDLLDVSRITSGKVAMQMSRIDLCELVRRCVRGMEEPARQQRHALLAQIECDEAFVNGDSVRLEQVVNNLLTNAIKYTPIGGRIETIVQLEGEETVILRVRDNGIGIAPELLPRVFDLFIQAEPSLDRSKGGLGIGLTLVRALVEMHDGEVSVRSAGPGMGSEFEIRLPRMAAPQKPAAPQQPAQSANGRKHRILVVEDQADARRVLQRLLQLWGHEVEAAEDGVIGLERALQFKPAIALIDVGLPGLDGYELARRLRASPLGGSIRLVALTGYGQPEDRDRAYEAGFDLHLVKPVDRVQLTAAIEDPIATPV